ncbi:hypothetical protein EAS64_35025 [Trebonia kvetii]|uniref:Uncharacterized protein n=1 Tax=Trebonia kvetii TaxID=2480626 RepID=A0A6P2BNG0_9ACTN|nr:hypothetical protein [Trebonia kvetii]TVZ00599.1 hypothetical protein EAS64_35025 [Trebonia kvetii]
MGKKSRLMIMVVVIFLSALAGAASPAGVRAAGVGPVDLAARMLQTSELPPGFQPYKPMTGPGHTARLSGKRSAAFRCPRRRFPVNRTVMVQTPVNHDPRW